MTEDLAPPFPLPGRSDHVLVLVHAGARTAPSLIAMAPRTEWCRVIDVRTGPYDLFPVVVRLPDGRHGAYQQHEILGWRPGQRRRFLDRLRRRG